MNIDKLKHFISKIENFHDQTLGQQIIFFGYYLQNEAKVKSFNHKTIGECFKALDLQLPTNLPARLIKLKFSGALVPDGNSYRIFGPEANKIGTILGNPSLIAVSNELMKLQNKLVKIDNEFLKEALECFKVKAWHAIVVLVWIITMDHLQDYVIKKNLIEFNKILQQNGNYRNIAINTKEDFEDVKDSDFIIVLRTLGWITGSQMKILEGKLNFRNSYAHPSTLVLTESMTVSFVEDLILNVVSKIN